MVPDDERARLAASLDYIGEHMMSRDEMAKVMADAVADGIKAAVSDPAMWTAAGEAMQQRAATATGGIVLGGLKAMFSRFFLIILIAGTIYAVGGWAALTAAWKAFVGGGQP